jgi:hypothetical protein
MVAGSKVITNHIGLSCFHSLLPTDAAFFNANQNQLTSLSLGTHPAASIKLTPTVSIGIVADTLGIHILLFGRRIDHWHEAMLVITGNTSRLVASVPSVSYCWCFSFVRSIHTTAAASYPSCCCLCSINRRSSLRVSFTLHNLLESYGSSCSLLPHQTVFCN